MYSVSASNKFNFPKNKVLEIIREPGHLKNFHPFCLSNEAINWPGEGSSDKLVYLNGVTYIRNFYNWSDNGFDLNIGGSKRKSTVNWIVEGDDKKSSLTVIIHPHLLYKYSITRWFVWNFFAKYMVQSYINHVMKGFTYYINTGNTVQKNQFGKHHWFS